MTQLLEASNVSIERRLVPTSLQSSGGELIALVGPNGSGKTSLLRALARVEDATGVVRVDGVDIDRASKVVRRGLLSLLPASREVTWPIAVRDVIALGLGEVDERRIAELVDALGLAALADRPINSLSTGERARALLARAVAARPRLLLLDEPLSNLDPYWVLRTLDHLASERNRGATVMVALHDLALLDRFDRLLLLDRGRIVGDGKPAEAMQQIGHLFGVEPADTGGWRLTGT